MVFDILGRLLARVLDEDRPAGFHQVPWSISSARGPVRSGLFFVRLEAGGLIETRKLIVIQ
jgi:hypothetical protein